MGFKKGLVLIVLYSFASSMGAPIEEEDDEFDNFSNPEDQKESLSLSSEFGVDEESANKALGSDSLDEEGDSNGLGGGLRVGGLDAVRGKREKRRTVYFDGYPKRKHRKALSTLHLIFG